MTGIEYIHALFFAYLIEDGWNANGACAILDELSADELMNMTKKELLAISEDYKDR